MKNKKIWYAILAIIIIFDFNIIGHINYLNSWTGFVGKTFWDWLQLLIIPSVIAFGGYWFSEQQNKTSLQQRKQQHETDIMVAKDQQREIILKEYIDNISELLLRKNLGISTQGDKIRALARIRTLTALRMLDPERKGKLVQFLSEADLINKNDPKIDLLNADLKKADLIGASLRNVNLARADLYKAEFMYADLNGADLTESYLLNANFTGSILIGSCLLKAEVTYDQLLKAKSLQDATLPTEIDTQANHTVGKKVLIIFKDNVTKEKIKGSLENDGFLVDSTDDGIEGLSKIEKNYYDITLLDISIPNLGGIDILENIKNTEIKHGKIIIITNLFDEDIFNKAFDLGIDGYEIKDRINTEDYPQLINKYLLSNISRKEAKKTALELLRVEFDKQK